MAGDVVLALGEARLGGLKDLSEALKAHQAGEEVVILVRRNEQELRLPVTLQAR
jgi:S1-C subfamily serine protease